MALATAATVIASQATISGTYSLTRQAIQLDYLPRMRVRQTSAREIGQIYIPRANWLLALIIVGVIVGFGSSAKLAWAYGVAVTGTMLVTTILTFFLLRYGWGYPLALCIAATGLFAFVDVAFFTSALTKIAQGGWFPLALGTLVFTLMTTWRRGRVLTAASQRRLAIPLPVFLESLAAHPPHRVAGTAVFMAVDPHSTPNALMHNLKHNKVLHERVVFLTVAIRGVPWVPPDERVTVEPLGNGFFRLFVHFGFMDRPDVAASLEYCKGCGLAFDLMETTFFLSRATVVPTAGAGMAAVAREPVRDDGAQRAHRRRLLQHSRQLRHRARHQSRNLAACPKIEGSDSSRIPASRARRRRRSRWSRSASSSATSAPARFTRSRRPSTRPTAFRSPRRTCSAACRRSSGR